MEYRGLFSVMILGALLGSCDSSGSDPILILGLLAPPTPVASSCQYTPVATGPFLGSGLVDLSLTGQYVPTLLLGNEAIPHPANSYLDLEDGVSVTDVTVTDALTDGTLLDTFTTSIRGFIAPASAASPGLGLITVPLVSTTAGNEVRGRIGAQGGLVRIFASVHVSGRLDGAQLASETEIFAVDACEGCLAVCPAPGTPAPPMPCVVGQDQILCRAM